MKPIIVIPKEGGKFDVQLLKQVSRPGQAEYTHMFDQTDEQVKKLLDDIKAQKEKTLQVVIERLNLEIAEINSIYQIYFEIG